MNALRRLARLVGVEAQKVLGGRGLLVGLVAVAGVTALTGFTHDPAPEETPWSRAALALSAGLWAAEIFLLVAGTTAISGEAAGGTLKMILPHAYRRSDWIFAKALLLAGQAVALLAVALGVAWAAAATAGGLGDVTQVTEDLGLQTSTTLHTAGEMRGYLASTASVALASLVATAWLGLVVSCLFDGVVAAVSTGFLLFLGFKSAGALFGAGPDVLAQIYAWYPGEMLTRLEKLGRGLSERWNDDLAPAGRRLAAWVGGGAVAGSLLLFTRRDLQ